MSKEWILCTLCACMSTFIIMVRNPISFVFGNFIIALIIGCIYLHLDAPFLAIIQILITTGTIIVLFLSSILMMNPNHYKSLSPKRNLRPIIGTLAISIFLGVITLVIDQNITYLLENNLNVHINNYDFFEKILKQYYVPFSLVSLLIFSSIVVVLTCTFKEKA